MNTRKEQTNFWTLILLTAIACSIILVAVNYRQIVGIALGMTIATCFNKLNELLGD